ncbi:hydroxymethylglutaryl-CoA lyase [Pseudarthrobacter niigatensis]|jgi:hydroxymethylglutaryl-CoA lyase|uniref:Hydroxymethylglutaryl-CoA lyase n=1 Tax=Pseudarthrobacter niigatensis TaxID=369935 RepID=A0AAJ1WG02_9MICC|nr:hydroxymethylglutaryl-CoA lyase [Pseudarthrobacter niigatensis]MDQ0146517.1 hydroxymethylglutaryl-CoA lyase [Pseudarthrobacter niigatensis]MDQ0266682.1 hydroxymethylglutaryl-CoA lyase [Pseudarthrobacter niigatensis]
MNGIAGTGTRGDSVSIVDVSPRDGLQNEKIPVSTHDKLRLINDLIALGARRIEAVSFVNPKKVPQMADADAVMAGVPRDAGASYIGLVLNTRGAHRAVDAGVDEINYVLPVTDAFAAANQNTTVAAALDALEEVSGIAAAAAIPVTVTAAVAFGCPYQGDVPGAQALSVVRRALQRGQLAEVALADTIGCAVPWQVNEVFAALASETGVPLRAHLHETRHTALANTYAAMAAGVRVFDSAVGGLGGCPFAPGAAGNISTEDLVWMLERAGFATSMDPLAATELGRWICAKVETAPRSGLAGAGVFPKAA